MAPCGLFFWLVVLLLIVAGLSYILGADKMGDFALNVIRLMIMFLLIAVLILLILILFGRLDWREIIRGLYQIHRIMIHPFRFSIFT
ncbi:MAG: hypothetical protein R6W73_06520 [Candidatus Saliniplasma sp.]